MSDENRNFEEEIEGAMITLTGDDGEEFQAELLDVVELDDRKYVVLLPEDEESDEVIILEEQDTDDPDEALFLGVDDEKILEKVFEIFKSRFEEDFDFE